MSNSLNGHYSHRLFSHIYIEEEAYSYPRTREILEEFPDSTVIPIKHYKDVFNRSHQDFEAQKQSQMLILAVKKDHLVYEGAKVCQDFGNRHFYYTSSVMNCIYDCEYCYLQGMYPSANLVLFVNLEDIFAEVTRLLLLHPVYLCISYDTDLLAMESCFHYVQEWIAFCKKHTGLTIELRTKSANSDALRKLSSNITDRFILAWTLSPDRIVHAYEHKTPSLMARITAIQEAIQLGYPVRLCFDPLLQIPRFDRTYQEMMEVIFAKVSPEQIRDISLGVFRISSEYLKQMRKNRPDSAITEYPYLCENGVFSIGQTESKHCIDSLKHILTAYVPEEKLFIWE